MIDVSEVITAPEFAQRFRVYRSTGSFVNGVWTESTPKLITMLGIVVVANSRDIQMLAEGDRVSGAMKFLTTKEIFVTRTGTSQGTSDKILWRGECYKIENVFPEADWGYWRSIGTRIKGA